MDLCSNFNSGAMRFYILILVTLFISSLSLAQDWELGAKGGINLASASLKNSSVDFSTTLGFHLGGYANTYVTDQVIIQPEVLFSLQGWESSVNDTRSLSYISVPVTVKYYLVDKFNVHLGPQLSFLIHADEDIEESLTTTDLSFVVGAEYWITDLWGAALRYNLGINDIYNAPESTVEIRSRVLQISAIYRFTE